MKAQLKRLKGEVAQPNSQHVIQLTLCLPSDDGRFQDVLRMVKPLLEGPAATALNPEQQESLQDKAEELSATAWEADTIIDYIDHSLVNVPRNEDGRVVRHGWTKLAQHMNFALRTVGMTTVVTPMMLRNRYSTLKAGAKADKKRGRPSKIQGEMVGEIRTYVDKCNEETKDGVSVTELAEKFDVCRRTMTRHIAADPYLQTRVQSIKIQPRIDWAKVKHIDHW